MQVLRSFRGIFKFTFAATCFDHYPVSRSLSMFGVVLVRYVSAQQDLVMPCGCTRTQAHSPSRTNANAVTHLVAQTKHQRSHSPGRTDKTRTQSYTWSHRQTRTNSCKHAHTYVHALIFTHMHTRKHRHALTHMDSHTLVSFPP